MELNVPFRSEVTFVSQNLQGDWGEGFDDPPANGVEAAIMAFGQIVIRLNDFSVNKRIDSLLQKAAPDISKRLSGHRNGGVLAQIVLWKMSFQDPPMYRPGSYLILSQHAPSPEIAHKWLTQGQTFLQSSGNNDIFDPRYFWFSINYEQPRAVISLDRSCIISEDLFQKMSLGR